ncbi:MAG: hypothetical protein R2705_13090 [Ilumatobacteraceae bacterium]
MRDIEEHVPRLELPHHLGVATSIGVVLRGELLEGTTSMTSTLARG